MQCIMVDMFDRKILVQIICKSSLLRFKHYLRQNVNFLNFLLSELTKNKTVIGICILDKGSNGRHKFEVTFKLT